MFKREGKWHIAACAIMGLLIGCFFGIILRWAFGMHVPTLW